jgi:integrase
MQHIITDATGKPLRVLTDLIEAAVKRAGLPARCVAHGLRKAALRRLAEHGSTTKEIAAVSGHRSLSEIERYTARYGFNVTTEDGKSVVSFAYASRALAEAAATHLESALLNAISVHPYAE